MIAKAVLGCPDVAALSDEPATYLAGRRVAGVVVRGEDPPVVEVYVVARWGPPLSQVAEQVRLAVGAVVPGVSIRVVIDDLDLGPVAG